MPDTNLVIGVASEQSAAVGGPGQGCARWCLALVGQHFGLEFVDAILPFQIPNLDGWSSGNAKPVFVRREAESVDNVVVIQSVQVFALGQIPQHCLVVFATRSAERPVGGDGNSVQVASVANVVGLQLAVGQVPNLEIKRKKELEICQTQKTKLWKEESLSFVEENHQCRTLLNST